MRPNISLVFFMLAFSPLLIAADDMFAQQHLTAHSLGGPPLIQNLRLQIVRLADDPVGGVCPNKANITPEQAKEWVDNANKVFSQAAVQFTFDPGNDFSEYCSSAMNKAGLPVSLGNVVAAGFPGKVVVFFRASAEGGGFSGYPSCDFVAMPAFGETSVCGRFNWGLLAHELGHYFGLPHTHVKDFTDEADAADYLNATYPKQMPSTGDFSGDGKDDIVTFTRGDNGLVYVAVTSGSSFGAPELWRDSFAYSDEVPAVGDFNGDNLEDIVVFTRGTNGDVYVSLSGGDRFDSGTGPAVLWHESFSFGDEIPAVGDFNGDGKDDIATFTRSASGDVYVALSDGTKFGAGTGVADLWNGNFAFGNALPMAADFNGDGRDDIVLFNRGSSGDVLVALSTGTSFGASSKWHDFFSVFDAVPAVGDFNGDGRDDVVAFSRGSTGDVFVALSDGTRFVGTGVLWHDFFSFGDEIPAVGDFNGDGREDIVTFTRGESAPVFVALSDGSKFGAGTGVADRWHENFSFLRQVFDGDGFFDTDPDPFMWKYQCGPTPTSVTIGGISFPLPRTNFISYYHPQSAVPIEVRRLTLQQISRIYEVIIARGLPVTTSTPTPPPTTTTTTTVATTTIPTTTTTVVSALPFLSAVIVAGISTVTVAVRRRGKSFPS